MINRTFFKYAVLLVKAIERNLCSFPLTSTFFQFHAYNSFYLLFAFCLALHIPDFVFLKMLTPLLADRKFPPPMTLKNAKNFLSLLEKNIID